jgi:hypothetical protein
VTLHPDAVRLRVLRLGFRPREVSLPPNVGEGAAINLALLRLPTLLAPIATPANARCPRRGDGEAALALWQQTRNGLLATIVAREANPGVSSILRYERFLAGTTERVIEQRVHIASGKWATVFGAEHSAEVLAEMGFRRREADGRHTWFGPDAEVLLDEAFSAAYCFSLADRQPARPSEVGLRFAPAMRRAGRVDINGTLWIDSVDRVLRHIEFQYVGLEPGTRRYRPGGSVRFQLMPNGLVYLSEWSLRLVTSIDDSTPGRAPATRPRDRAASAGSTGFFAMVGGGELASASWPDGTGWRAPLGTLRLRVQDPNGRPVPRTVVRLDSTDYTAVTDSAGSLEITGLLPGPYRAVISDSTWASIGLTLDTLAFAAARDSTVVATLVARAVEDFGARACGRYRDPGTRVLIARVVTPDGRPVRGARWQVGPDRGLADNEGYFARCERARSGDAIHIRVWRATGPSADAVQKSITPVREITPIRIELPQR